MFSQLISFVLSKMLFFALHIENNVSFPKPLSSKQEQQYFKQMFDGDMKAKEKLIEHNLRLVAHIVKKYYSITNDQEDLISIGTIGLIKAINTFSFDKKVKFSTYGAKCVENEILMHFRNIRKTASDISINEAIDSDKDGNALTIMDTVADEDSIIDNIDLKMNIEKLYRFVQKNLDERENLIIQLRYGLYGKKPLAQREIAKQLNISRSYVSRIEKKAIDKLKYQFDKVNDTKI